MKNFLGARRNRWMVFIVSLYIGRLPDILFRRHLHRPWFRTDRLGAFAEGEDEQFTSSPVVHAPIRVSRWWDHRPGTRR